MIIFEVLQAAAPSRTQARHSPERHRFINFTFKKSGGTMNNKWATLGLAAMLGLAAGCNKGDTSTNPSTDSSQQGAGQSASSQQPAPPPEPPKPIVVPAGTPVTVVLSTTISSRVAKPGDEFEATVSEPVVVEGRTAIPKGAHVTGTVVNAKKQGTFKGEADLAIRLTRVETHGKGYMIATDTYGGTQKGKGKRTAVVTGGGAAIGALIGGLAGGGKGAAIGAGVGAGGGLAASGATGGKNVEFPAETSITFKLAEPLTIER
jgi:hypothetical protein